MSVRNALNVLITPNYPAAYDRRMVNGLAAGFNALGHQAHALPTPVSAVEVAQKCQELSIDVVIQVNRTRHPEVALPPKVRHISWFQDVFPQTMTGFADGFRSSDILYALGDAGVLGLNVPLPCYVGSLVSGVDDAVINYRHATSTHTVDFSLCGFIPAPPLILAQSLGKDIMDLSKLEPLPRARRFAAIMRRILLGCYLHSSHKRRLVTLRDTVCSKYHPLRGELDIHHLTQAMRNATAMPSVNEGIYAQVVRHIQQLVQRHRKAGAYQRIPDMQLLSPYEKSINYFAREYPRLLDRVALINGILQVSDSLDLYGPGWDMHPNYRSYARGVIDTQEGLLEVYRRSRINLANNTHGLGLHSRTLECMAVGGFILTHESPHDQKPGGMLTSFEPGVHYGVFSPENLQEEAHYWLKDENRRRQAGQQAANVILQRHRWQHRAQQILDDLDK